MKNAFILLAGLLLFCSCRTTHEKQEVAPISISEGLRARVVLKGGKEVLITNRLENIRITDIEKVIVLNETVTWSFLYKDEKKELGEIRLKKKTGADIDRDRTLIVLDGVQKAKDFDLNSIKIDRIKAINVHKGASVKEKFNTTEFESVIEILTK